MRTHKFCSDILADSEVFRGGINPVNDTDQSHLLAIKRILSGLKYLGSSLLRQHRQYQPRNGPQLPKDPGRQSSLPMPTQREYQSMAFPHDNVWFPPFDTEGMALYKRARLSALGEPDVRVPSHLHHSPSLCAHDANRKRRGSR